MKPIKMLKLLREDEVAPHFRRLTQGAAEAVIAVPFWGKGAIKLLGLGRGQKIRVICNLAASACNPYVIADLKKLRGISLRTHPRLHAKIYAAQKFSIVGSSNASTNGLAVEGDTLKGWIEANLLSDDQNLVRDTLDRFDEIWASQETQLVTASALRKAKIAWDNRPKQNATPTARTLLAACRETPELFRSVFIAPYTTNLDPGARRLLGDVRKNAVPVPGLSAAGFRKASGYQFEEMFPPGGWILDLDCRNPDKPKVGGCSQVPKPSLRLKVDGEVDLTLTLPGSVRLDGKLFRIASAEKAALEAHARKFLRKDRLVSLNEAIRIIDSRR